MMQKKKVVDLAPAAEAATTAWNFDFSKISAAQMHEFMVKNGQILIREPLAILRLCLRDVPADWPEDLSQLPFATIIPLRKAFIDAAKALEADSSELFHFDVGSITGADVEDFMQGAFAGNIERQARVMARYELSLQKDIEKRMVEWKKGWNGKDKKFYADSPETVLIERMNTESLLSHPFSVFTAARSSFMDEVVNFGKNLNGQS